MKQTAHRPAREMNGSAPPLGTIQWSLTIAVSANARMVGSGTGRNERAGGEGRKEARLLEQGKPKVGRKVR